MVLTLETIFKIFALVEIAVVVAMFMTRGRVKAFFTSLFGLLLGAFAVFQLILPECKVITSEWWDIGLYVLFTVGVVNFIQGLQYGTDVKTVEVPVATASVEETIPSTVKVCFKGDVTREEE